MKWIDAFFCFRQQRVVVNGVKSDWAPVVSNVPQGIVLGPLLFSLHINDIMSDIESEIRFFADDCVCYREIKDIEDTLNFQKDIDRLGIWARKWGMIFQPVKCNMMQLTKKHNKIDASYTLEGTVLENVEKPHKATGPDNIPGKLMKEYSEKIAPGLVHLCQISIDNGRIPLDWK